MRGLPEGTITFLFTDLEGSTRLLQHIGDRYAGVLADHHRLLRAAFRERGGEEREVAGDGLFFTFPSARAALLAAVAAQRAVLGHAWPDGVAVRIRMGFHTGEPILGETGQVGLDIHRAARICAAAHGGQVLISQTVRDLVGDDLPPDVSLRDLGEHRLKDLARPEHLFQVVAAGIPADFPPLKSLDVFPNNLPVQLTSFIGREREIAEVTRLLASTHLLTLTGVGGCGKTRLSHQVAAEVIEEYTHGVWLVDLASLVAPELVPQSVASVLSVREEQHRSLADTLVDHLRPRRLLLVLDNCEHLLAACGRLAGLLLQRCPELRILATSREGLGVPGEVLYPVRSMSVPDLEALPTVDALRQYESVRLFADRASARVPGFAVTPQNAGAVAQVCHRLDGLPLAIELAVGRITALSPDQIARRLDDRFRLLTGGSHLTLPHHHTLKALIDWSHDLLSEAERRLFRRLSVFAGGWTLEAAEAVCPGEGIDTADVVDLLTQLVGKSLVVGEMQGGEVRYRLLETIRQYAREKLQASGEEDEVRSRHFEQFLRLAEEAEPALRSIEQLTWLRRLELEHDNIRAALDWARARGDVEAGLRLSAAFFRFWYLRGHFNEGRAWLEGLLASADASPPRVRARALRTAGMLARDQGDFAAAQARFDKSMALFRELGDLQSVVDVLLGVTMIPLRRGDMASLRAVLDEALTIAADTHYEWGIAEALHILGHVEVTQREYAKAHAHFAESVQRFRALDNKWNLAHPLTDLGREALRRGDYATARALFNESLAVFKEFGGKQSIASTLDDLGNVAEAVGDDATARALYEESLMMYRQAGLKPGIMQALQGLIMVVQRQGEYETARALADESMGIARELGAKAGIAGGLRALAFLAYRQGDYAQANSLFREGLRIVWELGNRAMLPRFLEGLALVDVSLDEPARAVRLLGASEAMREATGVALHVPERADRDRAIAGARAALGEEEFTRAWAEGRATSADRAVADVLSGR